MYDEFETRISYKYLVEVIGSLKEPICILGGWAVFFHVNDKFKDAQGRSYLGSRDIDLGFSIGSDLKQSALAETIQILKKKLKFRPLSFRLMKEIHTETEEELTDGKKVPAHFIFPMYVDLIVDRIPEDFQQTFGFDPIDEPLLKFVFENRKYVLVREFGKKLLLPKPELLLAMKIASLPARDMAHKRIKDMCDIFALAWYTGLNPENTNLEVFLSKSKIEKCFRTLSKEDCLQAGMQLGHSADEIERVFTVLLSK